MKKICLMALVVLLLKIQLVKTSVSDINITLNKLLEEINKDKFGKGLSEDNTTPEKFPKLKKKESQVLLYFENEDNLIFWVNLSEKESSSKAKGKRQSKRKIYEIEFENEVYRYKIQLDAGEKGSILLEPLIKRGLRIFLKKIDKTIYNLKQVKFLPEGNQDTRDSESQKKESIYLLSMIEKEVNNAQYYDHNSGVTFSPLKIQSEIIDSTQLESGSESKSEKENIKLFIKKGIDFVQSEGVNSPSLVFQHTINNVIDKFQSIKNSFFTIIVMRNQRIYIVAIASHFYWIRSISIPSHQVIFLTLRQMIFEIVTLETHLKMIHRVFPPTESFPVSEYFNFLKENLPPSKFTAKKDENPLEDSTVSSFEIEIENHFFSIQFDTSNLEKEGDFFIKTEVTFQPPSLDSDKYKKSRELTGGSEKLLKPLGDVGGTKENNDAQLSDPILETDTSTLNNVERAIYLKERVYFPTKSHFHIRLLTDTLIQKTKDLFFNILDSYEKSGKRKSNKKKLIFDLDIMKIDLFSSSFSQALTPIFFNTGKEEELKLKNIFITTDNYSPGFKIIEKETDDKDLKAKTPLVLRDRKTKFVFEYETDQI